MNFSLPEIILILAVLALLAGIYSVWQIVSLNRLRKTFFAGSKALDLESVIHTLEQELQSGQQRQAVLEEELSRLKQTVGFAVQKVGLVRFNPFEDGGGNFSFSVALLNAHDSGVVITSMHGRQQNRIYTKKIEHGLCDIKLTEEEQHAVDQANIPEAEPAPKKPKRRFGE